MKIWKDERVKLMEKGAIVLLTAKKVWGKRERFCNEYVEKGFHQIIQGMEMNISNYIMQQMQLFLFGCY